MVRFSQRESVLLGYSQQSQKSLFMNHHDHCNNPTRRNSDIDFSDVFGGPPRRSSVQEARYSFNGSSTELGRASNDDQEDEDEGGGDINGSETERIRDRLSGLNEKPVFGDPEGGVNKKGYPSEDFFDDIFKGKDYPLSSSPRKHERDSFSAPGSRVLSPVRPLPPRAEPLGGSSFPAHFSLPARLMKGTELPTFGSGNRNQHRSKDGGSNGASNYSYSPLSRFSSQANQVQEALENNVKLQSFLAKELSLSSEESLDFGRPDDKEKSRNLEKRLSALDSDRPEVQDKSNQFHFSIYKWASKGAPLEMPLRGGKNLEEKSKFERSSSFNGWLNGQGMAERSPKVNQRNQDFSSFNNSLSSSAARFMKELGKQKAGTFADTSAQDGVEKPNTVEANLPEPGSDFLSIHQVVVNDGLVKTGSKHKKKETEAHSLSEAALSGRKVDRISVDLQEAPKMELKPLRSLFFDNDHEAVIDKVAKSDISKESKVKSTKKSAAVFNVSEDIKKEADHGINVVSKDFDKAYLSRSPKNLSSSVGKNKSGGKVKEFVKIFNLEAATKPELDVESQRLSFRRKEMGKPYTTAAARVTSATIDEKLHSPNKDKTSDASVLVDKYLKKSEKQKPETRPNSTNSMNCTSGPKAIPASTVGSVPDGLDATFGDLDESFHGNYLIEELPHVEEKPPQTGATYEEFQVINEKIRQWSRGKEGNIRSLLSTLQYVLWPESGWKPVPLVDIIEENAVKRSYQKALLCLHPDKMQQKAAASHQKFIAEKVFDILQEAWTHFSSLGSV